VVSGTSACTDVIEETYLLAAVDPPITFLKNENHVTLAGCDKFITNCWENLISLATDVISGAEG
jgi:hypothetical protein